MSKLSDLIARGVLASRPAAGSAGRLYEATDSTPPTVYRDNGASWDTYATIGAAAGVTQLAYAELTTGPISVTGSSGSPTAVLSAPAFTADGTTAYWIEFYAPFYRSLANGLLFVDLVLDGTRLGYAILLGGGSHADMYYPGGVIRRKHTPAAGSRTFSIAAWISGANGEVGGGAGGTATYLPAYIRVTSGG